MDTALSVIVAVTFLWLGMVLAISFIEAPLKFRAPGVTLPIGLGIGRLVFRALNTIEVVLALVIVVTLLVDRPDDTAPVVALAVAIVMLAVQVGAVRPALTRRSDEVLAGADVDGPSSHAHLWYVGAEVVKVLGLAIAGVLLLVG